MKQLIYLKERELDGSSTLIIRAEESLELVLVHAVLY